MKVGNWWFTACVWVITTDTRNQPETLMLQTGKHHAERKTRVELDSLGVISGGGARQAGLQHWQDLDQIILVPHHQHRDQQGQGQAGTGASYGTCCVLTRVGALRGKQGVRCDWNSIEANFITPYNSSVRRRHCCMAFTGSDYILSVAVKKPQRNKDTCRSLRLITCHLLSSHTRKYTSPLILSESLLNLIDIQYMKFL